MQEIVQVITSVFECGQKENNDMISDIKDLRGETNNLISHLKTGILILEKKVDSLNAPRKPLGQI